MTFIQKEIRKNSTLFYEICRSHGIKSLYAFGSSISNRFDPAKSDIDLLVEMEEMDPLEKGEKLLALWDRLEAFFHRKVDLLTRKALRNPFLVESINQTKVLLYDNQRKEILV